MIKNMNIINTRPVQIVLNTNQANKSLKNTSKSSNNHNYKSIKLFKGDALKIMDKLIKKGIKFDAVITDLPYGTTACPWDIVIPLDEMWKRIKLLTKEKSPIVMTASQPFTSKLIMSNIDYFSHEWIWEKPNSTNPFTAKSQPMKAHESIVVFRSSGKAVNYFPQMTKSEPYTWDSKRSKGEANGHTSRGGKIKNDGLRYPRTVQKFKQDRGLHPTQKPIELMKYLVETYSKPGGLVLDITMGSGTTGVACKNLGRGFIGIELNKAHFDTAKSRIDSEPAYLELEDVA
jgi:site-specific DNA-methyltransferase (adenine-specific)